MKELVDKPKELYETVGLMHLKDWDYIRANISNEIYGKPANK